MCKVCAQLALLLKFYKGSCPEIVSASFGSLGTICNVFYAVLTLAGKEMVRNPQRLQSAGKENARNPR